MGRYRYMAENPQPGTGNTPNSEPSIDISRFQQLRFLTRRCRGGVGASCQSSASLRHALVVVAHCTRAAGEDTLAHSLLLDLSKILPGAHLIQPDPLLTLSLPQFMPVDMNDVLNGAETIETILDTTGSRIIARPSSFWRDGGGRTSPQSYNT